ncbi:lymphocyte antigen 6A-2/6E-1-like [Clupea harengus]|uniref:Lymphocyte antigen 6A-2/6E-1-like n=1 Tax=Clupea harengus TaxID=7950 RepID=A0A6P8G6Z7_CLUHA|nr:lymphocyte antigen 6A-2/6E-1-like [Clupea harengus]
MVIEVIFAVMCLLVSQAKGLQCTTCRNVGGSCSGPSQQCPALDSCASSNVATILGGSTSEVNTKSCVPSAQCLSGSMNMGIVGVRQSTLCCDKDNCNNGTSPAGVSATTLKGCATQSACSGALLENLYLVGAKLTCCEGDLCNSAWSATHSVLFLLWPLGSVLLFH